MQFEADGTTEKGFDYVVDLILPLYLYCTFPGKI